jgi:hypothetical protein|tara:strand:- start:443 stop:721 length:279 start_codon:yes stop_codon:yes gene_type:complete
MNKSEEKDIDFNNDLAFDLAVDVLHKYAEGCKVSKEKGMMDPMLGSYLLVNNLAIGLIFKAEGFESEIIDILKSAIEDAAFKIKKTKGDDNE